MKYTNAILTHGLAFPAMSLLFLSGVAYFGWSKFSTEADRRTAVYNTMKMQEMANTGLVGKLKPQAPKIAWLRAITTGDQQEQLADVLNKVEADIGRDSLIREKFRKEPTGIFGTTLKTKTEAYSMSFTGRYSALQGAALSVETHRPHMLLGAMTLQPTPGDQAQRKLAAEYTYSLFTNE